MTIEEMLRNASNKSLTWNKQDDTTTISNAHFEEEESRSDQIASNVASTWRLRPWRDLVGYVTLYIAEYPNGLYDDMIEAYQDAFTEQEGRDPWDWGMTEDFRRYLSDVATELRDQLVAKRHEMEDIYSSINADTAEPNVASPIFKHSAMLYEIYNGLTGLLDYDQVAALYCGRYGHFPLLIYAYEKRNHELFEELLKYCVRQEVWLKLGGSLTKY